MDDFAGMVGCGGQCRVPGKEMQREVLGEGLFRCERRRAGCTERLGRPAVPAQRHRFVTVWEEKKNDKGAFVGQDSLSKLPGIDDRGCLDFATMVLFRVYHSMTNRSNSVLP